MFAAAERKIFQVSIKSARETERQHRDGRVEFAKLWVHFSSHRDFDLLFETAAADIRHVGHRRPHAQSGATLCLLTVSARDERDFSRAELVGCAKFKDRCLFPALGNMQRLRGVSRNRQSLIGLRAQFDLGVWSGAFDVVGNGHASFEFVSRRGEHRHARCNYKWPANQRLALARADRVIRDRDRHNLQRAVEIIRHLINDFTLRAVRIDDA